MLDRLAADPGTRLIGDGSLLWLPDRGVLPVLPELELRYRTVRDNPLWERLPAGIRLQLQGCRLISYLTGRRISFNVAISPEAYGIPLLPDDPRLPLAIERVGKRASRPMPPEEAKREILAYLGGYLRCYPNLFPDARLLNVPL